VCSLIPTLARARVRVQSTPACAYVHALLNAPLSAARVWAPVPSAQSKFGQLAAGLPSTSSAQAQEQATICHRLMGWLISLVGTLMGWLAGWLADAGVPGAAPGSAGGSSVSSSLRAFLGRQKTIGADAVAQQVRVRAGDAAPCWMRVLSCMAVHACSCATPPCARPLQGHTHTHTNTNTCAHNM